MTTSKFKYSDRDMERYDYVFISIEYTRCQDVIGFKLENLVVFCLQRFSNIKFLLT